MCKRSKAPDAARAEAERAASVTDVEAASAKADTALKALQDIAQQMLGYTIKYNEWLFTENNLKPFSLYNQARANLLSTALGVDKKTVEDYFRICCVAICSYSSMFWMAGFSG
ncbi:hypothetical protein ARSEF4850_008942 [Beauveria asiatica]